MKACARRVRVRFMKVWFWDFAAPTGQLSLFRSPSHPKKRRTGSSRPWTGRVQLNIYGGSAIQVGKASLLAADGFKNSRFKIQDYRFCLSPCAVRLLCFRFSRTPYAVRRAPIIYIRFPVRLAPYAFAPIIYIRFPYALRRTPCAHYLYYVIRPPPHPLPLLQRLGGRDHRGAVRGRPGSACQPGPHRHQRPLRPGLFCPDRPGSGLAPIVGSELLTVRQGRPRCS